MAKSIEEYTAEVSKSYDNSRNALQNQINSIGADLEATKRRINAEYDSQQQNLNNQQNLAAQSASMAASRNGGSFGGAAEIANKKYYEQTFVPAQSRLDLSRNQSLDSAESQANSNRLALELQLASMQDEQNRLGLQRYYDELEREREEAYRQQQLALQREQNALARYQANSSTNDPRYYNAGKGNDYQFRDSENGGSVRLGTFIGQFGGDFNQRARDYISEMAAQGDANAQAVQNILKYNPNKKLVQNTGANYTANNYSFLSGRDNDALNILGLKLG